VPIKSKSKAIAVLEFGTFKELDKNQIRLLELLSDSISEKIQNLITK
jgi:hypothetical protein